MKINEIIERPGLSGATRQILRIMKLTTLIMTIFLLQVSAASIAQITLKTKQESLQKVLKNISRQSGYDFIYADQDLNGLKVNNINLNNVSIEKALQECLAGQPVEYQIDDRTVMVQRRQGNGTIDRINDYLSLIDVKGKVVDQNNTPLPGTSIKVKGTSLATVTNSKGEFVLKGIEDGSLIEVSFVGFAQIVVKATADMGSIKMEQVNAKLDEVIVQAYGTTSQRFATSNIGVIKADDIAKQPVSNPLLALQGRVPGLFITQTSGVSASDVNVIIQGRNSIANGSDPFYVIDGVPFSPQFLYNSLMKTAINGSGGSAFNFINPNDIESVSILKDADATAIYGSRAANGAILITTKKGVAGKTKVDVNMRNGWGKIVKKLDLMDTQEYLAMRKEAFVNAGQPVPTKTDNPLESNFDLTIWDQNKFTDWQKELVGGTAHFTDIQTTVSGGNNNTQFLIGYGYNRQTTVYPNSLADVKGNMHFKLNHNSNDSRFKYMLTSSYLQNKNQLNGVDLMGSVFMAPNAPALYKPDGSLNWEPYPNDPSNYSFDNPLAGTLIKFTGNTSNFIANNNINYEFFRGFQISVNAGYNRLYSSEIRTVPLTSINPKIIDRVRSASFLTKSINSWILEPQITFNKETPYGRFDVLIGTTFQENKSDLLSQTGLNYSSDAQLETLQAAPTVSIDLTNKTLYTYNALFSRLNYRLRDKYVLNLVARKDGSSRFGNENKFHTFYSIGASWLFGDEEYVKRNFTFLSLGKIRTSYGTTGNDQIGEYGYLSLLDTYFASIPYQQSIGLYPTRISNPFLQWEETKKLNIGLDLGFFKNRLVLNFNYFRNRSSNQLLNYNLPYITGFPSIKQNIPATVQNAGFEGEVEFGFANTKFFNWRISGNITIPNNKLISYKDLDKSTYVNELIIGEPLGIYKAYNFAGVNSTTGLYEFYDSKGQKTSSPSSITDRTEIIDLNPKFYGGISNSFQYKGFDLDFLFQFVKQNAPNYRFGNAPGLYVSNQLTNILERWKKVGDASEIQQVSLSDDSFNSNSLVVNSSAAFSGASYIRLKNASLAYSLPQTWTKKAQISNARIYVQGQNLLTVSNFIGTDPETLAVFSLPPLRMYTIGLQLTF